MAKLPWHEESWRLVFTTCFSAKKRGNAYNERGEEQLCRYLEYFGLQEGYLLSFCFNKTKKSGLLPPVVLNGRTLIEAIV